jgi:anaerobic selenocysteine-containing dehydrogenase
VKVSRRAFIQFAAGAVGGTLLSPLPWKLADDSAIWTQNWSWRPSPARGHVEKTPSTCLLCDGGCGIEGRLVEGKRAILVEGNPESPVGSGGVCALGAAGLQLLYAPYRIAQPMKRVGPKNGANPSFQAISWDQALGQLTEKLKSLRSDGKARGVAAITEKRSSSMYDAWRQFMTAYGSPNLFRMPSHADSLRLASLLTTGRDAPPAFAIENASYILSFGAPLADGWCSPARYGTTFSGGSGNIPSPPPAKLVQVEDRCSTTASKADSWVPIAPGTGPLLALAVAHVLIKENLYDADFANKQIFGFEDWSDNQGKQHQGFKNLVMKHYAPEQVERRTGVTAGRIQELAREFGLRKRAVVVWGKESGDNPENIYHDLTFLALNLLKGNLRADGLVGPVPAVPLGTMPALDGTDEARAALAKQRLDLMRPDTLQLPGNSLEAFLRTVSSGGSYPIELLMIHEANPRYSLPNPKLFESAVQKVGFVVSFSSYMDETASLADLILPNSTAFERYDDVVGLPDTRYAYYALATPILKPRLDTMHTGEVLFKLAGSMGEGLDRALPWKSYSDFLQERVKGLGSGGKGTVAGGKVKEPWNIKPGEAVSANYTDGDDLWKKLKGGKAWFDSPEAYGPTLSTPSGKFNLALEGLSEKGSAEKDDQRYLPHFAPPPLAGDEKQFPLLLMGYSELALPADHHPGPPFLMKMLPDTMLKHNDSFVEINPRTAGSLGLSEGDRVKLQTPDGEALVLVHLTQRARPGAAYIPRGLGHGAYDEYIKGKGANSNGLIAIWLDPVTGMGNVGAARAKLTRA